MKDCGNLNKKQKKWNQDLNLFKIKNNKDRHQIMLI